MTTPTITEIWRSGWPSAGPAIAQAATAATQRDGTRIQPSPAQDAERRER